MKIEKITISVGLTINVGGHEFTKLDIGCTADVEGDPDKAYDEVRDWCQERLKREVSIVRRGLRTD